MDPKDEYDVIVVGSGLAGSMTSACLSRNGARVLLVDAGSHPRMSIGESTIPATSMMMRLVAERYNVPEIKYLATFEGAYSKVTTQVGVKRNFGFVYHRPGERQVPRETHMFPIPKITHTENHFFRQDVDNWMVLVAVKYGTKVVQQTRVTDFDFDEDGVTATFHTGKQVRAQYVVDASGYRSLLAEKFGLREDPTRFRHHSRTLFTHMVGVKPYDELAPKSRYHHPSPWHEGTLHHIFPGGWMWGIAFDNHHRATNPLYSVGLQLDPRQHPKPDCTPEEEFRRFIAQYPDIAPQFANAKAVRDWTRTDRLQYSSRQTVGYRWCLTSHAAGFIDPLFSRGLSNTMETMNALVHRILSAIKDGDWSTERFQHMQDLEQGLLDFNDDLCANAYISFGNFKLWDAWFRIWSLGQIIATFEINRAYAKFVDSRDESVLKPLESPWWRGKVVAKGQPYENALQLLRDVNEVMQSAQRGDIGAEDAADELLRRLRTADFVPPAFGLEDPDNQWTDASLFGVLKTLRWAKKKAPADIGQLTYEGLTLFMKKRFDKGEFEFGEELKHALAPTVFGKRFRVPTPK
ncbi:NAD(P)/FAD-dependent oxidoreductase [Catellatospora bangladeshensis]|uniref:Halogenase n=1 Tax=Catellatospora bangladeshensis TaxID=310355 RepID=A0A8J3JN20_9ACTN|nr:NAD(P)/FAD-dependent oxidoreductase [Catellatospora bangladeshensis]GIF83662.1 halogenase [Catellatospora bangladeshensis]